MWSHDQNTDRATVVNQSNRSLDSITCTIDQFLIWVKGHDLITKFPFKAWSCDQPVVVVVVVVVVVKFFQERNTSSQSRKAFTKRLGNKLGKISE